MSEKLYRQDLIKDLISKQEISNQEELIKQLLAQEVSVTQATLSRDLRELKVSKLPNSKGNYIYQLTEIEPQDISTDTETLAFTGNLAVLKTRPGFANRIAIEIDQFKSEEILGTIAGDDTIFIAVQVNFNQKTLIHQIENLIPNIKITT
ncbi:arginine repressor [Moheibacter lacus]|uniref:Arginine repressor n=1 Tax=Moheibacter lacus TaxID=2745851 RepID=A0A838ZJ85_9FLAO|nr:ArgR family transcriptional regulator [Moheibacter lacus]MBA5629318.1 ArgR family transcriptional regulator [Moheibacter lacus]